MLFPSLRTILSIVVIGLLLLGGLILLVLFLLQEQGASATRIDFASLLPEDHLFVDISPALNTSDPKAKQWVVFYKRKEDEKNCIYGIVYRAHTYRQDRPQALLPWQLIASDGSDVCLGAKWCEAEVKEILEGYEGPELVIWGYQGDLRTRLSLFYQPVLDELQSLSNLHYSLYDDRIFIGDRGVRFDGETTIVVKKTIMVTVDGREEPLSRNRLCQYEVYEQTGGHYLKDPTRSTIRFRDERIPREYPPQPEEVVVAYCRIYHDEGARKGYLSDETAKASSELDCLGPPTRVEVLELSRPPIEEGNTATVWARVLIDGQTQRETTWSLRYVSQPTDEGSERRWQWRITGCSSP